MNIKIAIIVTILVYIQSSFIISEDDFLEHNLNIILDTNNSIKKKSIATDEIVKGTIYGKIEVSNDNYFAK